MLSDSTGEISAHGACNKPIINPSSLFSKHPAGWYQNKANPAFVRKVHSFRTDRLKIEDDF
jgi:hypothetical protein